MSETPRIIQGKVDLIEIEDNATRNLPSSRYSILQGFIFPPNPSKFWIIVCKAWNSLLKEINNIIKGTRRSLKQVMRLVIICKISSNP